MLSIKRVRLVILAQNGTLIVASVRWQKQTRHVYILRSKMWENTRDALLKMRAVGNSCSKGNIDRSKSALAGTDKI